MSYATPEHIHSEFKDVEFTPDSAITDTEVQRFLDEADAEIDMHLGVRYLTPITGEQATMIVRVIELAIVKDRIQEILAVKTGREESDQEGGGASPAARARETLKNIANGKLSLRDAVLASGYDGIRSYNSENNITHIFDTEKTQW